MIPARVEVLIIVATFLVPGWTHLGRARGDEPIPLKVRLEVARGPYYLGQGIELAVTLVAGDQRPALELPKPSHAELWLIGTSFKPVSATGIGKVVTGSNLYVTRLRMVARRAGTLEIPPIAARLDGRSGRSPAIRLMIEPVPLEARPAGFLGGVGEFAVQARVLPTSVAAGQEFQYRIEVTGPGAWGSTSRPELDRLGRLSIAPRIEPLADEEVHEPPSRTFLWRIRPTRPGSAVLPPVSIAVFDPVARRFITKATQGTPVKVVGVSLFDPKALQYSAPGDYRSRWGSAWAWAATLLAVLCGVTAWVLIRRGRRLTPRSSSEAARKFARRVSARWNRWEAQQSTQEVEGDLARKIIADLLEYARIGIGRPAGALTPVEAGIIIQQVTRSTGLAEQANALAEHCDRVLFSQRPAGDANSLKEEARDLFTALGQAERVSESPGLSESTSRTSG
jgi:hypothetical protein